MKVIGIAAVGKSGQIGLGPSLPWFCPEDLRHFKESTSGHLLIMGRKTYESIGKPLSNRECIVLTKTLKLDTKNQCTAEHIEDALDIAKFLGKEKVFICGGAEVYEQYLPFYDELWLSEIDYDGKADTYFPNLDMRDWKVGSEQAFKTFKLKKLVRSKL